MLFRLGYVKPNLPEGKSHGNAFSSPNGISYMETGVASLRGIKSGLAWLDTEEPRFVFLKELWPPVSVLLQYSTGAKVTCSKQLTVSLITGKSVEQIVLSSELQEFKFKSAILVFAYSLLLALSHTKPLTTLNGSVKKHPLEPIVLSNSNCTKHMLSIPVISSTNDSTSLGMSTIRPFSAYCPPGSKMTVMQTWILAKSFFSSELKELISLGI